MNWIQFFAGFVAGAIVAASIAALAAAAYTRLLKFHARREWRTPVIIAGETFYILPEGEYKLIESIRGKALAVVSSLRGGSEPWRDRADHDMSSRGGSLRPGS